MMKALSVLPIIVKRYFDKYFIMKSKNGALDGMRGLAILLVYNVHSLAGPNQQNFYLDNPVLIEALKTIQAGHIGVDLFYKKKIFQVVAFGYFCIDSFSSENNTYGNAYGTFRQHHIVKCVWRHCYY